MSEINIDVSLPLDNKAFLRRECPLCIKQFKIQVEEDKINEMGINSVEKYLLEEIQESNLNEKEITEYTCPYCGQVSKENSWWTEEQLNYMQDYAENLMIELINENLIGEMKKMARKNSLLEFKGKKLKPKKPWIAPETSDEFKIVEMKCCNEKVKIEKNKEEVYCYYCGFKHKLE